MGKDHSVDEIEQQRIPRATGDLQIFFLTEIVELDFHAAGSPVRMAYHGTQGMRFPFTDVRAKLQKEMLREANRIGLIRDNGCDKRRKRNL